MGRLFGLMGARRAGGGSAPGLRIVPLSVPTAEFGVAYEATWQVLGGTAPYTLTDSTLPTWADAPVLTGDIITVTGTPDAVDAVAYLLEVTDDVSAEATREGTITTVAVVPDAPTNAAATAGDATAEVDGDAPASNGGATVTLYRATSSPGGITATNATLPITITGLTNGVEYTFTVAATNSVGYGAESSASNAVTPAAAGYTTSGSYYDGSAVTYWTSGVNGGVDTGADRGIFSIWVKAASDGTDFKLCNTAHPAGLDVSRLVTTNILKVVARTDSTILVNASTSTTLLAGAWHHILVAWDITNATSTNNWLYCYYDGTQVLADTDIAQGVLNFSSSYYIGAGNSIPTFSFTGDVSEVYLQLGETLDITNSANRLKFRDAAGKPVSLGATGATPTGTQPKVYAPDGDPTTNAGSAGNATLTGSLSASSTSPSD